MNKKNPYFKSDDDKVLYMRNKSGEWILKLYPAGRVPSGDLSFVVPADVVGIDEGAFYDCKLERVIVQDSVKSIAAGAFAVVIWIGVIILFFSFWLSVDVFS